MNIIPALQHHLNQTTPHKWEPPDNPTTPTTQTTILTPLKWSSGTLQLITHINITQNDNTLTINHITGTHSHQTTIDLLDPEFLTKIHQIINSNIPRHVRIT